MFRRSVFEWYGLGMVWTIAIALAVVLVIRKYNYYIRIQDGGQISGFAMVGLFGFGTAFTY